MRARTFGIITMVIAFVIPIGAQSQRDPVDTLLSRAGARTTDALQRLSDVTCKELVLQQKLGPKGGAEASAESTFDYLVSMQEQGQEPAINESRQLLHDARTKKDISLLVTNGFATQLLIFHPFFQSSFRYERLADVVADGKPYAQIHFEYMKGRPTPAAMLLRGREYPMPLAGTALLDPMTGDVKQIDAMLASSMEDLGLKEFHSNVIYNRIEFPQNDKAMWLPVEATVEVFTPRQHWKNVHRFTNYHLFSVNVSQDVAADKIGKDQP